MEGSNRAALLPVLDLTVSSLNAKRRLAWCPPPPWSRTVVPVGGLLINCVDAGQALKLALARVPETLPGSPACQAPVVIPSVLGGNPRMQRRGMRKRTQLRLERQSGGWPLPGSWGGLRWQVVFWCCSAAKPVSTSCNPVAGHLYPHKLPSLAVIMLRKWPDAAIPHPSTRTLVQIQQSCICDVLKRAFGVTEVKGARASSGPKKPNENPVREKRCQNAWQLVSWQEGTLPQSHPHRHIPGEGQ